APEALEERAQRGDQDVGDEVRQFGTPARLTPRLSPHAVVSGSRRGPPARGVGELEGAIDVRGSDDAGEVTIAHHQSASVRTVVAHAFEEIREQFVGTGLRNVVERTSDIDDARLAPAFAWHVLHASHGDESAHISLRVDDRKGRMTILKDVAIDELLEIRVRGDRDGVRAHDVANAYRAEPL